jgi:hypothetical protein
MEDSRNTPGSEFELEPEQRCWRMSSKSEGLHNSGGLLSDNRSWVRIRSS